MSLQMLVRVSSNLLLKQWFGDTDQIRLEVFECAVLLFGFILRYFHGPKTIYALHPLLLHDEWKSRKCIQSYHIQPEFSILRRITRSHLRLHFLPHLLWNLRPLNRCLQQKWRKLWYDYRLHLRPLCIWQHRRVSLAIIAYAFFNRSHLLYFLRASIQ